MGVFKHAMLSIPRMGLVIERSIQQFFSHIPGLEYLLEHTHVYIEEWVQVFYATLYVEHDREYIQFMFAGRPVRLYRQTIAQLLGVTLYKRRLHRDVYGDLDPLACSSRRERPITRGGGSVLQRGVYSQSTLLDYSRGLWGTLCSEEEPVAQSQL